MSSSFLTQCPHCLTSFRVTERQLEAADGLVRCGACLGIFSAAANQITLKQDPDDAASGDVDLDEDSEEDLDEELSTDEDAGVSVEYELEDEDDDEFIAGDDDDDEFGADDADGDEFLADDADDDAAVEEDFAETEYEFVLPDAAQAPEPAASAQSNSAPARTADPDEDLIDTEDFDIPLGDLNLFDDEGGSDEAAGEYEEEESFDEESADDAQDEAALLATASEAFGIARRHERDDYEDDEDEYDDDEDEDEDDEELEEDVTGAASSPPPRAAITRVSTDKTELRRYLAEIEDDAALEPLDDEALDDFEEEPVFLDTAPRRSRLVTAALFFANVLLAAVLALQYAAANIERLDRSTGFAPLRPYVCRLIECPAPQRSRLAELVSEQLLVRSHPRYAQALEVNLVFRNDAAEAQPFPALELGFHDTGNRLLANRVFQPGEYLPPELRTSDMPAHSSLQVMLELADPGSEAVNYTLVFREP